MHRVPKIIILILLPFSILFHTKKSFVKMLLLFIGATLYRSGKTVCGCLRALGQKGETAFANYHHLLSRCKINMLKGSKVLIEMLLPLTNYSVIFVVDEHLERRRGAKIKAKATYRDPVASSKKRLVKCFGLKWIVLTMLIKFPWSKRSFALPVFCTLRYPENQPKYKNRKLKSGTDLICQMLMIIRGWFPHLPITLLGDGDYARVKFCEICKRLSINLVARMRTDARLHDDVPEGKRKGRRPRVSKRLTKPTEWKKAMVNWYGGQVKEIFFSARNCLWLAGKGSADIQLKAIWVQLRATDKVILMATNLEMDVLEREFWISES